MVEDRWVYVARRFTSIESSFNRVTFTAIVPSGAYTWNQNVQKNVLKWRTFELTG